MKSIYLELPIVKVDPANNWQSKEYAAEHFEKGLFIADDGIMYDLVFYQDDWLSTIPIPKEQIEAALVEEARQSGIAEVNSDIANDIDKIKDRVEQIARLVGECRDKCDGVINNFVEVRDDLIDTIDKKFSGLPRSSGEGVNILDVARSFAVIQKPELIKEL